jgi:hypothetical protein
MIKKTMRKKIKEMNGEDIDNRLDRLKKTINEICKYSIEGDIGEQLCYSLYKNGVCIQDNNCIEPVDHNLFTLKVVLQRARVKHIDRVMSLSMTKVTAAKTLGISYRTLMSEIGIKDKECA